MFEKASINDGVRLIIDKAIISKNIDACRKSRLSIFKPFDMTDKFHISNKYIRNKYGYKTDKNFTF